MKKNFTCWSHGPAARSAAPAGSSPPDPDACDSVSACLALRLPPRAFSVRPGELR